MLHHVQLSAPLSRLADLREAVQAAGLDEIASGVCGGDTWWTRRGERGYVVVLVDDDVTDAARVEHLARWTAGDFADLVEVDWSRAALPDGMSPAWYRRARELVEHLEAATVAAARCGVHELPAARQAVAAARAAVAGALAAAGACDGQQMRWPLREAA